MGWLDRGLVGVELVMVCFMLFGCELKRSELPSTLGRREKLLLLSRIRITLAKAGGMGHSVLWYFRFGSGGSSRCGISSGAVT